MGTTHSYRLLFFINPGACLLGGGGVKGVFYPLWVFFFKKKTPPPSPPPTQQEGCVAFV